MQLPAVDLSGPDEAIRFYLDAGLNPILIHAPITGGGCTCGNDHPGSAGKHPIASKWQKPQTLDELQDQLARIKFTPNIGIVLGEQRGGEYLIAVDVDDEERFAVLVGEYGPLPETVRGESGRGYRLLFELGDGVDFSELLNITGLGGEKGVDVKIKGGQVVVAPSIHVSGKRYTWSRYGKIERLPPSWVLAIKPKAFKPPEWAAQYTPQTMREDTRARNRAEKYLEKAVIGDATLIASTKEGSRNTLLHARTVALLSLCGAIHLAGRWSWVQQELYRAAKASGLADAEIRRTIASAEKWVRESGSVRVPVALVDPIPSDPSSPPPPPPTPSVLLSNDRGSPAKTAGNVALMLQQHPDWCGGPAFDSYSQMELWPEPIPLPIRGIYRVEREIVDADHAALQGWLMSQPDASRVRAGLDVVASGIHLAAAQKKIDLLRDWVNMLTEWDRVPRMDSWTIRYLGCEDNLYIRSTGRCWILAVIQRALSPGLHVDAIPVLEGPGGIGKNRAIDILFQGGPSWAPWLVGISGLTLDKDETKRLSCTRWVLHDDELRASGANRIEALKSWASRTLETYRLQYKREITVAPRRGLLIGSIDRDSYLHDDNVRRWWPWKVGTIRADDLARDRLQLFAEALHAVRNGEHWRDALTERAYGQARETAENRRVRDPLLEQVTVLLGSAERCPAQLTTQNIGSTLGYGIEKIDRSFETRLGNVMRELGFTKERPRGEDPNRPRVYVQRVDGPK